MAEVEQNTEINSENTDDPVGNKAKSTDPIIGGLTGTKYWSDGVLSFAFAKTNADKVFTNTNYGNTVNGSFDALLNSTSDVALKNDILWAIKAIEAVSGLDINQVSNYAQSDLKMVGVYGLKNAANKGLNGRGTFPGTDDHDGGDVGFESYTFFDTKRGSMTTEPETGGSSNRLHTVIHELMHTLGFAHPHDTGGGSSSFGNKSSGAGDNVLDNDRYTVMSYERGGLDQNSQSRAYGYAVTPMALDIAAFHHLYGSSTNHTGNTTYLLTDPRSQGRDLDGSDGSVAIGRAFYSIWDTGGTDLIKYAGNKHVLINLNQATLNQSANPTAIRKIIKDLKSVKLFDEILPTSTGKELRDDILDKAYHAGGFFSRVFNDNGSAELGGYSIANGKYADPTHNAGTGIENALGANKSDILIGNRLDNKLRGKKGADLIHGGDGKDQILGDEGHDVLFGGDADDKIKGGKGDDAINGGKGEDTAYYTGPCSEYRIIKKANGTVLIRHIDGSKEDGKDVLKNVEIAKFANEMVRLDGDIISCLPTELVFLQDLSGSFYDDLPNMVGSVGGIMRRLEEQFHDIRFALATYLDGGNYGSPVAATDKIKKIINAYKGFYASGDEQEALLGQMVKAANGEGLGLRNKAQKIILVATDEPYNDNLYPDYTSVADVKSALKANKAVPIFAVTSSMVSTYQDLVAKLGVGAVVTITSNSDNFADAVRAAVAKINGELTEEGTDGDDNLTGTPGKNDGIFGGLGNDTISGRDGNDTLDGGAGDDTVNGGRGADEVNGGSGNDTVKGGGGGDTVEGGDGDDMLFGGAGPDLIFGGLGKDQLFGNAGNDVLNPGKGRDQLTGGLGKDRFDFEKNQGRNKVLDYQDGKDKIDLAGFNFGNKNKALAKFFEIGTATDDMVGFKANSTTIIINGADLADIGKIDILV